eukprot:RCo029418
MLRSAQHPRHRLLCSPLSHQRLGPIHTALPIEMEFGKGTVGVPSGVLSLSVVPLLFLSPSLLRSLSPSPFSLPQKLPPAVLSLLAPNHTTPHTTHCQFCAATCAVNSFVHAVHSEKRVPSPLTTHSHTVVYIVYSAWSRKSAPRSGEAVLQEKNARETSDKRERKQNMDVISSPFHPPPPPFTVLTRMSLHGRDKAAVWKRTCLPPANFWKHAQKEQPLLLKKWGNPPIRHNS